MQWQKLFEDSGIEYVTRSPNTKRGEISIKCPWCGDDDPSHHLGISLTTENWGCLRNLEHRGHNPLYLLTKLLGVTRDRARLIEQQYNATDPTGLEEALALLEGKPKPIRVAPEEYPRVWQIRYRGNTARFWQYLKSRGFGDDVGEVVWRYNLKCCTTGRFADRVIIPLLRQGKIIAWTSRAIIDPVNAPRYLSSELTRTTVFNEDVVLRGGKLLFITEGPFDAIKIDFYAKGKALATCAFGITPHLEQINLLRAALKVFARVVLLYDQGAESQAFALMDWLHAPNVVLGHLPTGVKDPGMLSPTQIQHLVQENAS